MTRNNLIPVLAGSAMGAMMLWMVHQTMTGTSQWMGTLFILTHLVVVALAAALAAFGLGRKSTWARRLLAHRPNARHMAIMLGAAAATALAIHGVHGGPSWI